MSEQYFIDLLENKLAVMEDRYNALREDVFSEIGRLTFHIENYALQESTQLSYAARIEMLWEILRKDDERA